MKNCITKVVMVAVSLMLFSGQAHAVEAKNSANAEQIKSSAPVVKGNAKAAATDIKVRIVDINSATDTELKAVPGIGDTYAAKIISGRPYANKGQLKSRNILPGPVYEKVKDLIIARQVKK